MTTRYVTTKADLLADIDRNWTALQAALDKLAPATMTTIHDDHGWTVKDHIVHIYY